jgi:hypothetical protein
MERKEELEILIENQQSKLEKFWEKANKTIDGLIEQTRIFIANFAKEHGEDISETLVLRMHEEGVYPALKGCSFGDVIDIRLRKEYIDGGVYETYLEVGGGSSGLGQKSEDIEFVKAKLRGLLTEEVRKDIKGESTLVSLMKSNMSCINNEKKAGREMEAELQKLKHELSKILFDEVVDEVIDAGGVKLPEPVNTYIRNSDNRRTWVDQLVIEKATDKSITIKYLNQGVEQDTYRQSVYEARRDIHAIVKLSEEIRDKKQEAAA